MEAMEKKMNVTVDMSGWDDSDKCIFLEHSAKGYSVVVKEHYKLNGKRVVVHKKLEQDITNGERVILVRMKKLQERDNFYLLCDAERIEPEYVDLADFIGAGKKLATNLGAFMYDISKSELIDYVGVLDITTVQRGPKRVFGYWYEAGEIHYASCKYLMTVHLFSNLLTSDIIA